MGKIKEFAVLSLCLLIISSYGAFSEDFRINNIGFPGFDQTNQEYTNNPNVALITEYNSSATTCVYANENLVWSSPENCQPNRFWRLSAGEGIKTVNVQITYSFGDVLALSDTIYYNASGGGLDTTPPLPPIIVYPSRYTNNVDSVFISWFGASDQESELLGIPLSYVYRVYKNGGEEIESDSTFETSANIDISSVGFVHGDNLSISITTTNSAGLETEMESDGMIIDTAEPSTPSIGASISQRDWSSSSSIQFDWDASDALSGIYGFSHSLLKIEASPDNVPEGYGNLADYKSVTLNNIPDGIYHFNIIALDNAGNPSDDYSSYEIWIDSTPPSRPTMINPIADANDSTLTFRWQPSFDLVSGIDDYELSISANENFTSPTTRTTSNTYLEYSPSGQGRLYARVMARNNAGLSSVWSNEKGGQVDTTAPAISSKLPSGRVISIKPRLSIETDEKAVCYHATGSQTKPTEFLSTNAKHHETYVEIPDSESTYTFRIYCFDTYNNSASTTIVFDYIKSMPTSIVLSGDSSAYFGGIVELNAQVRNNAQGLEQLEREKLSFYLNDEPVDDYYIADIGRGDYTISIDALDSLFDLGENKVRVGYGTVISNEVVVSFKQPELTIKARNMGLGGNYSRIWSNSANNFSYGIAFNSNNLVYDGSTADLMFSCPIFGCQGLIFLTKKEFNKKLIDEMLQKTRFLGGVLPSFGYLQEQSFVVDLSLNYQQINILGDEIIPRGRHNLIIENVYSPKNPSGKKTIRITSRVGEAGEQIFKYD